MSIGEGASIRGTLSLHSDLLDVLDQIPTSLHWPVEHSFNIGRALSGFRNAFYNTGQFSERSGDLYDIILLLYVGQLLQSGEQVPGLVLVDEILGAYDKVRSGSLEHTLVWLRTDSAAKDQIHALAQSDYFAEPDEKKLAERNPYAKASPHVDGLEFLMEEHGFERDLVNHRAPSKVKELTEEEIVLLLHTLHGLESPLATLVQPYPVLTHHENLCVALQHARLWLLKAEAPLAFLTDIKYSDLRSIPICCGFADCQAKQQSDTTAKWISWKKPLFERLCNPKRLPSGTEASLRSLTLDMHSIAAGNEQVHHDTSKDCPVDCPMVVKHILRLKLPMVGSKPRDWKHWSCVAESCDGGVEEFANETYKQWRVEESDDMYRLLIL